MATWTDITSSCSGLTTSCPAENYTDKKGYLSLVATKVEQSDPTTNQTRVTWELRICGTPWVQLNGRYATMGGETIVAKNTSQVNSWSKNQVLNGPTTTTFDNNDDGTISLPTYVKQLFYYGYSDARWTSKTQEKSGEIIVPQLARASIPTISPASGTLDSTSFTISTNRQSSDFTHVIEIYNGSSLVQTVSSSAGASVTWSPTINTYASLIPGTSKTFTIKCTTKNGSATVGTAKTCTVTLNVPDSVKPTISVSGSKADSVVPSAWNVWVKGKSQLTMSITATAQPGTTISNTSSSAEGSTYNGTSFTVPLNTAGNRTITSTVTDTRGRTNSATYTYTVVDYVKPAITTAICERCNSSGTPTDNGTYVKYSFAASISSVSNKNSKTFKIQYREKNGSTWNDLYTYTSGYSVSVNNAISASGILNASKSYDFKFLAQDTFEPIEVNRTISTGFDLMHFNVNGNAIAFGKKSEATGTNKLFEVGMPANFTDTVKVGGNNIGLQAYPIGSIYMSWKPDNPGTLFGGTWEQIKNVFLWATNTTAASTNKGGTSGSGSTTGQASGNTGSTTLTSAQCGVPAHSHGLNNHTHSFSANFYIRHGNTSGTEIVAAGTNTTITKAAYSETWGNGFYVSTYSHKPDRVNISGTSGGNSGSTANNTAANASSGHTHTLNSHTHTIPYVELYVWKRTA